LYVGAIKARQGCDIIRILTVKVKSAQTDIPVFMVIDLGIDMDH
jgi:hypothetical protein